MKKLFILTVFVLFATCQYAHAQCPAVMPTGTVCISQAAANAAKSNALELAATKGKVDTLNQALKDKDVSIKQTQDTATANQKDLEDRLHKTEVDLATANGQIIEMKADKVLWTATIQFLLQNQKGKQNGLINFKVGGN